MNIEDLTIRQVNEIKSFFTDATCSQSADVAQSFIGKYVIIRTYSAGNWAGYLEKKSGGEVILSQARRLFRWFSGGNSISLSGVATHGVVYNKSRIVEPVDSIWLEAIEIIPATAAATNSIKGAPHDKAD